jgi:hypothetical protein
MTNILRGLIAGLACVAFGVTAYAGGPFGIICVGAWQMAISRVRPRKTARRFGRRDQRPGAPEGTKKFKEKDIATIRASAVTSGGQVVAIGYPLHGLLTSDLTVTHRNHQLLGGAA